MWGRRLHRQRHALRRSLCWLILLAIVLLAHDNAPALTSRQFAPDRATVLQFDGTDDRAIVPYDASFPTEVFTASAWIKLTQPSSRAAIIARGEDDNSFNLSWQLYVTGDGTLEVMLEDTRENNYCYPLNDCVQSGTCTVTGDLFVADDAWHHVPVARDSSADLALYIDGQRRASCEATGVPSSNNFQDLSIGCTFGTIGPPPGGVEPPTWFFPGQIDEPAMWNVALTDAEIAEIHSVGVDPLSSGLVGYWAFDEGSGQALADMSPAHNDGYLGEMRDPDSADPLWLEDDTAAGLTVQPPKLDFRKIETGVDAFQRVTVTNQAPQDVDIFAIKLTGGDRSQFTMPTRRDTCSSTVLAPQQSCEFRVGFKPTAMGRQRAKVVIKSSDPNGSTIRVKLRGTGVASSGEVHSD